MENLTQFEQVTKRIALGSTALTLVSYSCALLQHGYETLQGKLIESISSISSPSSPLVESVYSYVTLETGGSGSGATAAVGAVGVGSFVVAGLSGTSYGFSRRRSTHTQQSERI